MIGKSTGTIGQYERGEIFPTYHTMNKLVKIFNFDTNIFFEREDASKYSFDMFLILNLFSRRSNDEQRVIRNFLNDITNMLNLVENNMGDSEDGGEAR